MAQAQRTRVMASFKKAAFSFLVATDVAARGIDVNDLELVVNYDLPYDPEDYVHRIGRTGRAGRAGRAVTLVSGAGMYKLQSIERFTRARIRREVIPTVEAVESRRSGALHEKLKLTLEAGDTPRSHPLVERLLEQGYAPTEVAAAILHHFAPPAPVPTGPDADLFPKPRHDRPHAGGRGGKRARPHEARPHETRPHEARPHEARPHEARGGKPRGKPRKFGPRKGKR
jgi:ATP-dependent RNA helicase DeaD